MSAVAVADEEPVAKRPVAPRVFTVLSLALAPVVVALAVLLLPASGSTGDTRPVIQVLPRPTTAAPAPAAESTDDPGTLVRP
jgi:hypothetical protein